MTQLNESKVELVIRRVGDGVDFAPTGGGQDVIKPETPFLRTPYNYDMDYASAKSGLYCDPEEAMTQQSFKDECDINNIMKQFGITGQLPENVRVPQYGDFTGIDDFQTAMNAIRQAQEDFYTLPAELRDRFQNDPQRLLEFVGDDRNRDEAKKLGLLKEPVVVPRGTMEAIDELKEVLTPKSTEK